MRLTEQNWNNMYKMPRPEDRRNSAALTGGEINDNHQRKQHGSKIRKRILLMLFYKSETFEFILVS